jgi:hypothetical protein
VASALELIGEAIDALTQADAARLERLAQQAHESPLPSTELQKLELERKHRALAHLLTLTRRNLRLLGKIPPDSGSYGERHS